MHIWIAVDLAGRGLQHPRLQPLGKAEHVDGAHHTGLGRVHGIVLIVDRRGRAGEIVDLVDLDIERERHVMAHDLEFAVVEQLSTFARVPVKKLSTQSTSQP